MALSISPFPCLSSGFLGSSYVRVTLLIYRYRPESSPDSLHIHPGERLRVWRGGKLRAELPHVHVGQLLDGRRAQPRPAPDAPAIPAGTERVHNLDDPCRHLISSLRGCSFTSGRLLVGEVSDLHGQGSAPEDPAVEGAVLAAVSFGGRYMGKHRDDYGASSEDAPRAEEGSACPRP